MQMAQELVQGMDLWINTPRRPWEASGTSGMKVLVNGGLNFSELDGWWAEAYSPQVGWAIGDGQEHGDDPAWDAAEAEAMYTLLEREVVAEFYERSGNGTPIEMVGADPRKYGPAHAGIFRRPHHSAIHRGPLPPRCLCIWRTCRQRQRSWC